MSGCAERLAPRRSEPWHRRAAMETDRPDARTRRWRTAQSASSSPIARSHRAERGAVGGAPAIDGGRHLAAHEQQTSDGTHQEVERQVVEHRDEREEPGDAASMRERRPPSAPRAGRASRGEVNGSRSTRCEQAGQQTEIVRCRVDAMQRFADLAAPESRDGCLNDEASPGSSAASLDRALADRRRSR